MPEIVIDKFDGGKNSFDHQLLLEDNQCASASKNVWAPMGALTKMAGATLVGTMTGTGAGHYSVYADDTISSGVQLYHRVLSAGQGAAAFPWSGDADSLTPLGYVTGSVSVSGASLISATGSGTLWSSHVSAGDLFSTEVTAGSWVKIASVQDDTHLTLSVALAAAVPTGSSYRVLPALDRQEVAWASLNGSIWSSTEVNLMQRYDTTGMTRIAAAPKATFLQVHKNYLFAARTSTAESRLYWSAIKDPTSWPASNFVDVDKDNGKISGLFAFGNELVVFKTRGLYKVVGDVFDPANPTYAVYPIGVPKGFAFNSNYSAATVHDKLYFYSHGAVYAYAPGTSHVTMVSIKWDSDFPTTFTNLGLTNGIDQRVYGFGVQSYYILKGFQSSFGSGSAFYGIVLDTVTGAAWFVADDGQTTDAGPWNRGPMVLQSRTGGRPRIVTCGPLKSRIYSLDLFASAGTFTASSVEDSNGAAAAISADWRSREHNIGYGSFKTLSIFLEKQAAGNLTVSWSVDQGAFTDNTVDMTTGRGNLIRKVLAVNRIGSTIQLKITQAVSGQTFKVFGLRLSYETHDAARIP